MKSKAAAKKQPGRLAQRRDLIDESTIRKIAKQCVYAIRGCLREEEWLDAEEEFRRIISVAITEVSVNAQPANR